MSLNMTNLHLAVSSSYVCILMYCLQTIIGYIIQSQQLTIQFLLQQQSLLSCYINIKITKISSTQRGTDITFW